MNFSLPRHTTLRIRKILTGTWAVIACVLMSVSSATAQDGQVILPTREITLRQSLEEIQRQTQYRYLADWNKLPEGKRVTASASILTVRELLNEVLSGTGYTYHMDGQYIVFSAEKVFQPQNYPPPTAAQRPSMLQSHYPPTNQQGIVQVPDPWSKTTMRLDYPLSGTTGVTRTPGYWANVSEEGEKTEIVMINFRVAKSLLERDFMNNASALNIIDRTFSDMQLVQEMDYMTITAAASPEGNTPFNEKLAAERALAIKSYIMWKHPYLNRDRIITYSAGEDWSGLKKMIENDPFVPGRMEVLSVLDQPLANDQKRARLKQINGGETYRYLNTHMFPYLRGGAACMIYYKKDREEEPPSVIVADIPETHIHIDSMHIDRVETLNIDTVGNVYINRAHNVFIGETQNRPARPTFIALKTNLLYDAALTPNVGIEFYLGSGWSLEAEGNFAWWKFESSHKRYRVATGGLELRKWLSPSSTPLHGHFIGLYGMAGMYDIKLGSTGYESTGAAYSAGLSYGYSTPIGRKLNLEFSLGLGYIGGKYKEYEYNEADDCYPWLRTRDRTYFGPTKAKVSLVWLIGNGSNNKGRK